MQGHLVEGVFIVFFSRYPSADQVSHLVFQLRFHGPQLAVGAPTGTCSGLNIYKPVLVCYYSLVNIQKEACLFEAARSRSLSTIPMRMKLLLRSHSGLLSRGTLSSSLNAPMVALPRFRLRFRYFYLHCQTFDHCQCSFRCQYG